MEKQKSGLVVKDNALINASYNLEVIEQRLIMLAILSVRKKSAELSADTKIEIHASEYAQHFGVSVDASYKALKGAVDNLFDRQFTYLQEYEKTGKIGIVKSRWVSRIHYVQDLALLEINFAPDVIPLITKLEKRFTSYKIEQIANLTSKYSLRLFELISSWKGLKKTPMIPTAELRELLGVEEHEYKKMNNFKVKVLDFSVKQINENTDMHIAYTQEKSGRAIAGFTFTIKTKAK